jgi:hypothetical protein
MLVFLPYVSCLISLIYGKTVLSVFSLPTLLSRGTYMSYGGGGREVKRISVNPLFSAPTHGVGEGRGPIFRAIPPVTTYYITYILPFLEYPYFRIISKVVFTNTIFYSL